MLNSTYPSRRRQHSPEFKARIVAACLQPGTSVSSVAIANDMNPNVVRRWIREHEYGKNWMPSGQPRAYVRRPVELKRMIIAQCLEPDASLSQIAAAYGVSPAQIQAWIMKLQAEQAKPEVANITPPGSSDDWLPVVVAGETAKEPEAETAPMPRPSRPVAAATDEASPGQIVIDLNGARLQLQGTVALKALRVVMECLVR